MAQSTGLVEYYEGKSIFITGATGFMGTVLVEKLLRCCPDVKTLYLLMRPKKGQTSSQRLKDFFNCKVFHKLHNENPRQFDKIKLIAGDICEKGCGMSDEDIEELEKECQIVFHLAACVRFDIPIRDSVNRNIVGTLRVLQLAERMRKLEVFLYSSTSFCHDEIEVLEDKLYPGRHNPHDIMNLVSWMDDELLNTLEKKLIKPKPNVYAYTKALTEDLVREYAGKFTIALARPSIVVPAYKEPMPGWVDNINGPVGVVYAAARGVLHSVYCHESTKTDAVPVDIVINGCIILAYRTGLERPKEIRVCNITQSNINSITYVEGAVYWRKSMEEYPLSLCLWYPSATAKNHKIVHEIAVFFTHLLPAYFVDFMLFLLGKKTFMRKVHERMTHGLNLLEYYNTKDWYFNNEYFSSFKTMLSKEENEIFYTDISVLKWPEYMRYVVKGIREYYVGEDASTLPQARKLRKRLYVLHVTTLAIFYFLGAYLLFKFFSVSFRLYVLHVTTLAIFYFLGAYLLFKFFSVSFR